MSGSESRGRAPAQWAPDAQGGGGGAGAGAPEALEWRETAQGLAPVSTLYDDPYFSLADGLAETRHVYLDAAALPARMAGAARFEIGELGFGVGLATLAAWELMRRVGAPGGVLRLTSFEAHPLPAAAMARAHAAFPELAPLAAQLRAGWAAAEGDAAERRVELPGLSLRVMLGDARARVPQTRMRAQAWFLDGFAPRKNPALWDPALLAAVARRVAPGGTATTYSAAGAVRRALAAAGFAVEKRPGFGFKRDMTLARLRPEGPA